MKTLLARASLVAFSLLAIAATAFPAPNTCRMQRFHFHDEVLYDCAGTCSPDSCRRLFDGIEWIVCMCNGNLANEVCSGSVDLDDWSADDMYCYTEFGCPEGIKCVENPPREAFWTDICACDDQGTRQAVSLDCGMTVAPGQSVQVEYTSPGLASVALVTLEDSIGHQATIQVHLSNASVGVKGSAAFVVPSDWEGVLRARSGEGATCATIF